MECTYIGTIQTSIQNHNIWRRTSTGGNNVQYRVKLHYEHLLQLAVAGRTVRQAVAAGSVPPELKHLWSKFRALGIQVKLFERHDRNVLDVLLQRAMYQDLVRNQPSTCVLIRGIDEEGEGFLSVLKDLQNNGWNVKILSWRQFLAHKLRQWVIKHGLLVPLETFYLSITYLQPSRCEDGTLREGRAASPLELEKRPSNKPA